MKTVLEDVEFTAKAYPKALAAYENENGASVVMMPEDCYSIGTKKRIYYVVEGGVCSD